MELKNLIEEFYITDDFDDNQSINWLDSYELLSLNRFDIAFKLFYLNYRYKCSKLAKELYRSHINIITNGTFKEFGNSSKDSFESYLNDFNLIYESIKKKKFDKTISLIPINSKGSILLNGAHRIASAIHLGVKVPTITIKNSEPNYNLNFFKKRGISNFHLELALLEYLKIKKNIYVACIWPKANSKQKQILEVIGSKNILYTKTINFSPKGAQNLISILYDGHSWLGNIKDGYGGAISKYSETFNSKGNVTFVFFEDKTFGNIIELKSSIRSLFKLGKHSIHINDTHEELLDLSKYVLNENSIYFLNNFNPLNIKNEYSLLIKYNNKITQMNYDLEDFVVSGSYPLQMLGIVNSNDLDYISKDNVLLNEKKIDSHNKHINYYHTSVNNLIYDPSNYFYYKGLKFLSPRTLMFFKEKRGELKDRIVIYNYLKKQKTLKYFLNNILYSFQLVKFKSISLIIKYSKPLGVYNILKSIYKKF